MLGGVNKFDLDRLTPCEFVPPPAWRVVPWPQAIGGEKVFLTNRAGWGPGLALCPRFRELGKDSCHEKLMAQTKRVNTRPEHLSNL